MAESRMAVLKARIAQAAFELTWRDGAYYVSKQSVETCDVVPVAEVHAALDEMAQRAKTPVAWRWRRRTPNNDFPWHVSFGDLPGTAAEMTSRGYDVEPLYL